jgi:hypothetical protein
MAIERRKKRIRKAGLRTAIVGLPLSATRDFYQHLIRILDDRNFDEYVEKVCENFYSSEPCLTPSVYFRLLMVGYFEGIDSEVGIALRASDSLLVRSLARIALGESAPDHLAISRTRRRIDVETHQIVFQWVLVGLAEEKLLLGTATDLAEMQHQADTGLRPVAPHGTGERLEEFLSQLAEESGIQTPTRKQLASFIGGRPSKGSDDDSIPSCDSDTRTSRIPDAHLVRKTRAAIRWRAISREEAPALGSFDIGGYEIDLHASVARTASREIPLTPMEDCVLKHLAAHRSAPVPHGELAKNLWGEHSGKGVHSLRCFIRSLRRKLELDPAHPKYIVTVPGIGYCLRP